MLGGSGQAVGGSASESKTTTEMLPEKQKRLGYGTDSAGVHIREVSGNSLESCAVISPAPYFRSKQVCAYLSQRV